MILKQNLDKISHYNKLLSNKIEQYQLDNFIFQLVKAESGDVNLIYKNIPLHNQQNPQQEAILEVQKIPQKTDSTIILLMGLGLGYLFKSIFVHTKCKIVVYEPNFDILKFTLNAVDFSSELADDRVKITTSLTELTEVLSNTYQYKNNIISLNLAYAPLLYQSEITQLQQEFPAILEMLKSNFNTLFKSSFKWLTSSIYNLPNYKKHHSLEVLKNKFKNKPAIIVSPGPSLDETIDFLKQYRNKVIIFCANIALKALKKHDITPDFIIFIDCVYPAGLLLKEEDLSGSALIAQSIASRMSFQSNAYEKFVFYSQNDLFSRWLAELTDFDIEQYVNKGTVSYCGLLSAFHLGCNPLILTGQNLAYKENRCYSSTSVYGELSDETIDNISAEKIDEKFIKRGLENKRKEIEKNKSKTIQVKGQHGEILKSTVDYASFIKHFEQFASENADRNLSLINCTPGGAQINGYENKDIKELLESLPSLDIDVKHLIKTSAENSLNPINDNFEKIEENINTLTEAIRKIKPTVKNGREASESLLKELRRSNKNNNKISNLTNIILESYKILNDEIFDKHKFLLACSWEELSEMSILIDDDIEINLDTFVQIAQKGLKLFKSCEENLFRVIDFFTIQKTEIE